MSAAGDEAVEFSIAAELIKVPEPLRLWVDDVTPEALASILAGQHGRLAVLSAEGGLFGLLAGRYSATGSPNFEVVLKAHAGDALRVDRKGRPSEAINCPALTIGVTVQPDVISGLLREPSFRGRGLLGRFLYSIPQSLVGRRDVNPPTVPPELRLEYGRIVAKLMELPRNYRGEEILASDLALDQEAHETLVQYMRELEPELGPGGDLAEVTDWAAKLAGAVVRIAGLLHIGDSGTSADEVPSSIGRAVLERAIRIAGYLVPHAINAYARMGQDPARDDGLAIIAWLRRKRFPVITKRQVQQALRARFPKAADIDPALALLVEHGYLRAQDDSPTGPGRPSSTAYDVHPDLHSDTHNAQNCVEGDSEHCEDELEESS